jgi:hypothetical protein
MWPRSIRQLWSAISALHLPLPRVPETIRFGLRHVSRGPPLGFSADEWGSELLVPRCRQRPSGKMCVLRRVRLPSLARIRAPFGQLDHQGRVIGCARRCIRCDPHLDQAQAERHRGPRRHETVSGRADLTAASGWQRPRRSRDWRCIFFPMRRAYHGRGDCGRRRRVDYPEPDHRPPLLRRPNDQHMLQLWNSAAVGAAADRPSER